MAKKDFELTWKEIPVGSIVHEPGNASEYQTGDWRSQMPVLDKAKCVKCGICYRFCPEPCIVKDDEGYYVADLYYCKGCGICAYECPKDAITIVKEEH